MSGENEAIRMSIEDNFLVLLKKYEGLFERVNRLYRLGLYFQNEARISLYIEIRALRLRVRELK